MYRILAEKFGIGMQLFSLLHDSISNLKSFLVKKYDTTQNLCGTEANDW